MNLSPLHDLLHQAIQERAFPGASLIVTRKDAIALELHCGRQTYDRDSAAIAADTVFDLASLTKVIVTTSMAMLLYERGALQLEQPIVKFVPEFAGSDERRSQITVRQLLTHTSGLPAHKKYYEHAKDAQHLLAEVYKTELEADPGRATVYSDVGFILLGVALERIANVPLESFYETQIAAPLGIASSFGPLTHVTNVPPTLECVDFRMRRVVGQVNDENAWVMGGVAPHAGLFGTARDVSVFARCMLRGGAPVFQGTTVEIFTVQQPGTTRALGWDKPTTPSQSGKYLSGRAYGHLGYTGTSLWIDPPRDLSITLLTNRTYPDNKSQAIKRYRPLIHDAVIEALNLQ